MKNDHSFSIDQQIGTLLAFIILFQKKIEQLRIKIAGNQQFHSRLAFQFLDNKRKSSLSPEDLCDILNRYSTSKSLKEVESFCTKYTTNGSFSYDEFIKFITPKTNKMLAQRLMISTYRAGTQLPQYILQLIFEILQTAITMLSITENIRKQIQQNTQLTHVEIMDMFKKSCTSKEKLFYFINASTNGQGDYDFTLQEMKYLTFHVRGSYDLQELQDHQFKEILYPLDMNYQKTLYNATSTQGRFFQKTQYTDMKNRTDYFKTKKALNRIQQQQEMKNATSANFLKTNYRQTSKGGFYNPQKNNFESKEMFAEQFAQNVETKTPTAMSFKQGFPHHEQRQVRFDINNNQKSKGPNIIVPSQRNNKFLQDQNDASVISQYGNMYIQKFVRGQNGNDFGMSRSNHTAVRELDNFIFEKYALQKKKQVFYDEFGRRNDFDSSDNMSNDSAFVQY